MVSPHKKRRRSINGIMFMDIGSCHARGILTLNFWEILSFDFDRKEKPMDKSEISKRTAAIINEAEKTIQYPGQQDDVNCQCAINSTLDKIELSDEDEGRISLKHLCRN